MNLWYKYCDIRFWSCRPLSYCTLSVPSFPPPTCIKQLWALESWWQAEATETDWESWEELPEEPAGLTGISSGEGHWVMALPSGSDCWARSSGASLYSNYIRSAGFSTVGLILTPAGEITVISLLLLGIHTRNALDVGSLLKMYVSVYPNIKQCICARNIHKISLMRSQGGSTFYYRLFSNSAPWTAPISKNACRDTQFF